MPKMAKGLIMMDKITIEQNILEKLWSGELYVSEQCLPTDEAYDQLLDKIDQIHKKLQSELQKQEKVMNQIEDYIDLVMEASECRNREAFKRGFGMAVSMILEAVRAENK